MIEVMKEIIEEDSILIFKQPKSIGTTYLSKELTNDILIAIMKDFKDGWLKSTFRKTW